MELQNKGIEFKYDLYGSQGISSNIFPQNFCCLIIGKPGSGKTTLLRQFILDPSFLYRKFDYVFIASPSLEELPFILNATQMTNKFDINWFFKVLNDIEEKTKPINILIIIDDFISFIKKNQYNPNLISLFYNRRHIVKNGIISIILTSQRYMTIPPQIRSTCNMLVLFRLSYRDILKVCDENISISNKKFISLFDNGKFVICNLESNTYYSEFDQVVFSQ